MREKQKQNLLIMKNLTNKQLKNKRYFFFFSYKLKNLTTKNKLKIYFQANKKYQ